MTAEEFAEKIREKIDRLKSDDKPLRDATVAAHAKMAQRIFEGGKDSSEGSIGSYSTKPIYLKELKDPIGGFGKKKEPYGISPRNSKGLNPKRGKAGNTEFKTTDRARITSYFEGWKGFREVQGLETSVVNLNYTGDMRSDFSRPIENLAPFKVANNEYVFRFSRDMNNKKARGNEEHFKKTIFKLSKEERDLFFSTATREIKRLLR